MAGALFDIVGVMTFGGGNSNCSFACAIIRKIITPFMCFDSANEVVNRGDSDAFDDNNFDAKE